MGLKSKDIEAMDISSLKAKEQELRKELIRHNAQIAIGTVPKSPGQIKQIKKNIAKILTAISKKESVTK